MKFLVFAETRDGQFKNSALEVIGLSAQLGETHALVIGPCNDPKILGNYGAKSVYHADSAELKTYTPEGYAQAILNAVQKDSFDGLFAPATQLGKDTLPRVAAKLGSCMLSEITDVTKEGESLLFKRPIFAGKVFENLKAKGEKPFIATVRPNIFSVPEKTSNEATVAPLSDLKLAIQTIVKEVVQGESGKLDLTEANIVISGGRSLKSAENFKVLNDLAQTLGAAVGASRAAVDAGYATHSMQVGQTGKTVSPTLYIACGISGAIQHLAGMRTSKCIVAINTDLNAPIFQIADYGIVGDLFEVVPLLNQEFKKIIN